MAENITDRTLTVYEGEVWGLQNVYIFPETNRDVRGVMWVIPGCDNPTVEYGNGSGFCAQNFVYDQIKLKIQSGHIPQDDWIIVIAPRHNYTFIQLAANSDDIFREQSFNLATHLHLCGCCTDKVDREYINVIYAMGDGAGAVDFNDPLITNVVLVDPVLYPPIDIPDDRFSTITMVANPGNHDPISESGNATLIVQEEIGPSLGSNLEVPSGGNSGGDLFNHLGLFAAGLLAFNFAADLIQDATSTGVPDIKELSEAAEINRDLDDEMRATDDPVVADPNNTPAAKLEMANESSPAPVVPCVDFKNAQIIITSDRLIFDAKQDSILMSSNTHIGLSAKEGVGIDADRHFTVDSPEINLGLNATEPIVLGDKLGDWLDGLISTIQLLTYTNAGGPTGPAINAATLNSYKTRIPSLKSPQNKTL